MTSEVPSRIVCDTNILVSAFLFPQSIPGQAFGVVLGSHRLLMSLELAIELAVVMRREKFDQFLSLPRREELIASMIRDSEFVATSTVISACRDLSDNRALELAVDGNAAAIITGDADLLVLHPFRHIEIVTPRDFLLRAASE